MAESLLYRLAELQGISLIMKMKAFLRITICHPFPQCFAISINAALKPHHLYTTHAADIREYTVVTLKMITTTKLSPSLRSP
jgi:hypothetical protein